MSSPPPGVGSLLPAALVESGPRLGVDPATPATAPVEDIESGLCPAGNDLAKPHRIEPVRPHHAGLIPGQDAGTDARAPPMGKRDVEVDPGKIHGDGSLVPLQHPAA